jgi:clan AA aspartic protease
MTVKLVEHGHRNPNLIQSGNCMGEIRVDVTFVNAIDEGIVRRGGMAEADIRRCQTNAVVDTGAVRSCIPINVVEQLGLTTTGRTLATYADGRQEVVDVTEPIRIEIAGRSTYQSALVLGDEVLIGQLVLEDTDLWADCRGQRLVPNPAHPDQPVFPVK